MPRIISKEFFSLVLKLDFFCKTRSVEVYKMIPAVWSLIIVSRGYSQTFDSEQGFVDLTNACSTLLRRDRTCEASRAKWLTWWPHIRPRWFMPSLKTLQTCYILHKEKQTMSITSYLGSLYQTKWHFSSSVHTLKNYGRMLYEIDSYVFAIKSLFSWKSLQVGFSINLRRLKIVERKQ